MSETANALYRSLPSMNSILLCFESAVSQDCLSAAQQEKAALLFSSVPRPILRESVESYLGLCRTAIAKGNITDTRSLSLESLMPGLLQHVQAATRPHFRKVLNATGVVIHTNLGRSLLADVAVEAITEAARDYSNLEFNLSSGERGSRYSHVESLICRLTGAEAALVVNNNAAAVLLMLDTLCKGREVIVSRGELVEIGGSFRIPEVMEKSGCRLRETGATNRTHLNDYERALNENTAALMKVHTSNFRIIGFTKSVDRKELAALAHAHGLPLLEDLGSGTLIDFQAAGYPHLSNEPTASQVLEQGADVVTFSGDKILGGPQAGIIAGKAAYIDRIKKNPMNRALRIDKLTLAGLEATLRLYVDPETAMRRVPSLRMILMREEELQTHAGLLLHEVQQALAEVDMNAAISLKPGMSRTGGGAFPECDLPTRLVCIRPEKYSAEAVRAALLQSDPPLLARVENDELRLDPRTLREDEFTLAAESLRQAYSAGQDKD